MENRKKLNLGCGHVKIPGFIGVDNNPTVRDADVRHDLNVFPYPFADSSIAEILTDHVLEHLNDPIHVLEELYRISASGARLVIKSPHFSCNWLHPGHKSAMSTMLFSYFARGGDDYYGNCTFIVERVRLRWLRPKNAHPRLFNLLSRGIDFFANLHPGFCQRVWCYWVGGFEEIEFAVRVVKP